MRHEAIRFLFSAFLTAMFFSGASAQQPLSSEAWLGHVQEDLLPFWDRRDAWGEPVGNFPSRRCNSGEVFVFDAPCDEISKIPWLRQDRTFIVALSRQIYAYGVAFHLTGDPRYLRLAEAGAKHLLTYGVDRQNGLFFTYLDARTFAGSGDIGRRTSQQQAYGLLGLSFLYYLTGRDQLLAEIRKITQGFQRDHYDSARGFYVFPGDRRITLASQLDHLNAYMHLLSRQLPEGDRQVWTSEMARIADTLIARFFVEGLGLFSNELIGSDVPPSYDFGHTIKAFWFIRMAGAAAGRPDLVRWAEIHGRKVLDAAFVVGSRERPGTWAFGYRPDFALDPTPMSWVHAELSQFTASLALADVDLQPRLAEANRFWMGSFVDQNDGGVWDRLDAETAEPARLRPKHWPWKAGYHSFEHALVGYVTAGTFDAQPIRLFYARDDMAGIRVQPYYFMGQVTDVQTRTASDGQTVQRVEFTDIRW